MNNLTKRVITAIVLLLGLLALLFYAQHHMFTLVLLSIGGLAVWECWRLIQGNQPHILVLMMVVYGVSSWVLMGLNPVWILGAVALTHLGVTVYVLKQKPILQTSLVAIYASVLLACVIVAIVVLHQAGVWVLLTAMLMVWAADIGGYFVGRTLGGKLIHVRLASVISPKKSWEGAIGGTLLAAAIAVWLAHQHYVTDWITLGQTNVYSYLFIFCITVLFAAYSVTGDLVESLLKRQVGVKDSSQLLPGHGGILDRIDALIPVLPLCAVWVLLQS